MPAESSHAVPLIGSFLLQTTTITSEAILICRCIAAELLQRRRVMESSRGGAERKQQPRRLQHQPDRRQRPPGIVVQVALGANTTLAQVRRKALATATDTEIGYFL
jgi:hypothetical protein